MARIKQTIDYTVGGFGCKAKLHRSPNEYELFHFADDVVGKMGVCRDSG